MSRCILSFRVYNNTVDTTSIIPPLYEENQIIPSLYHFTNELLHDEFRLEKIATNVKQLVEASVLCDANIKLKAIQFFMTNNGNLSQFNLIFIGHVDQRIIIQKLQNELDEDKQIFTNTERYNSIQLLKPKLFENITTEQGNKEQEENELLNTG